MDIHFDKNHTTTPALLLDMNSDKPLNLDTSTDTDAGILVDEAIDPILSKLSTGKRLKKRKRPSDDHEDSQGELVSLLKRQVEVSELRESRWEDREMERERKQERVLDLLQQLVTFHTKQ